MSVVTIGALLLFFGMVTTALGEPVYYYEYKSRGYPYTDNYNTYYTNPFRQYVKYNNYNTYRSITPISNDDDTVYITDMYGATRVSSARSSRGLHNNYNNLFTIIHFLIFITYLKRLTNQQLTQNYHFILKCRII